MLKQKFFNSWSKRTAYLVGYIAADGSITIGKRGNCYLDIQSIDKELVEIVRKSLDSNNRISLYKNPRTGKSRFRSQIGSKYLIQCLDKLGLKSKKSHRLICPKVPDEYFSDFLRGYLDGDGSISLSSVAVKKFLLVRFTTSTKSFLDDLSLRIYKQLFITGSIFHNQSAWRLNYSGTSAYKLLNYIYSRKSNFYLSRKYQKYLLAANIMGR